MLDFLRLSNQSSIFPEKEGNQKLANDNDKDWLKLNQRLSCSFAEKRLKHWHRGVSVKRKTERK